MKKINGKIVCGVLAASMFVASFTGCGKLDGTQTVATVDGEKVTLGLASYLVREQQAQTEIYYQMLAQSYGIDLAADGIWDAETEDGKTAGEDAKDNVMETIESMYAIKAHAKEYDVEITEDEQAKIEEAAKAFMEDNSKEALAELAVAESDIATYLELMTYRNKMREAMVADVDREVSEDEANQSKVTLVKVSTVGTEKDDEGNTIELTEEEKEAKKELAEKIKAKIAASENVAEADMSKIAKEIDEDVSVYSPNFTTAGSEDETVDETVRKAALALKDGELASKVVEGADGYYVVRLDKKLDEEATESKKESIISQREQEMFDALVEEWVEAAEMTVEEDVWKKVKVTDSKSFQYKQEEKKEDSAAEDAAEDDKTEDAAEEDAE